ncbi:MAG: hypothetical protein U0176_15285 [Bacteroidia bacterium]
MEKSSIKSPQNQSAESQTEGHEGGSNAMSPPAFQLMASPADTPIQRVEAPGGGDGAGESMIQKTGKFFSGLGAWFKSLFGGGANPQLANNGGQQNAGQQNPGQQNPGHANAGQQKQANKTLVNKTAASKTPPNPPAPATVNVTRSVGVGGANLPADVRQVQSASRTLGYLSATDFQAERADTTQTAAIAETAMVRTIVAISQYMTAAFGRPGMLIEPNQASATFINNNPAQGLGTVAVGGDVGRGAQNNAADVRAVQQRLSALGYLQAAGLTAEGVAATATGRIADASLTQTIAAINAFNIAVAGTSLYVIRANGREQQLLNNPPRFTRGNVSITNSVGTGGQNNVADVTAVQTRLVQLGYLTQANQTAEQPAQGATGAVTEAALVQTIAAMNQFQHAMNVAQNGRVVPGDETHRQMINPTLPEKGSLNLTGSVGRGGGNARGDVRAVQERLQTIGLLSTSDYMAERVDTTQTGNIAITAIPRTQAAIEQFTGIVVGTNDGRIDAGGRAMRLLNDPTYGSLTNFNTEANNAGAGYDFQSSNGDINRVIRAVEQVEAGNFRGEIGAVLTNGAGVAASFGKGQVIGSTALGTLRNNRGMMDHYGLTNTMLTEMSTRATNTNTRYDAIYALVPAGGSTQGQLNTAIRTYTAQNAETFVRETGLGTDDIARMFHTANMRRRIIAVNVPRNNRGVVDPSVNVENEVTNLLGNAEFSGSTNYLGVNRGSITTYFRNTATMGENRAAFQTKAIFNHPEGQRVRNAMTDNNGTAIGRTLVQDTYNSANGAVPGNTQNRLRAVAAVTAIMHNRGGSAASWAGQLQTVYTDAYVRRFLPHWDNDN